MLKIVAVRGIGHYEGEAELKKEWLPPSLMD